MALGAGYTSVFDYFQQSRENVCKRVCGPTCSDSIPSLLIDESTRELGVLAKL